MNTIHYKNFTNSMTQLIQKIIAMDRVEKFCYGVTLSQANAIGTIYKKETLTMNELSQQLGLAISTLTRIIDILVRDGIVDRNSSEQDRRKVCICLTGKGTDLAEKLQACSEQFWSKIFDALPEEKKEEVIENLNMLLNAIESVEKVCFVRD